MRRRGVFLAAALLASATAAAALAQSSAPDPGAATARPVWTRQPSAQDFLAQRPTRVVADRTPGGAILNCTVTAAGGLGACKVETEAPAGYGYGAAALKLAPLYRMATRTADGRPTMGQTVRVPVTFDAKRVGGAMSLINYPIWIRAPDLAAVEAAYPVNAGGGAGAAVVRCAFDVEGRTTDCELRSEAPAGKGFGAAALALADQFVVQHQPDDAGLLPGVIADIPIALRPRAAGGRTPQPQWINALTAAAAEDLFPPPARAANIMVGTGTVSCLVNSQGGLTDCRVAREQPSEMGFGDAAMQASKLMVMNPWSEDGEPLAGRRMMVPIRLRLVDPDRRPLGDAGGVIKHFELK